jgi:hypothetical protein
MFHNQLILKATAISSNGKLQTKETKKVISAE